MTGSAAFVWDEAFTRYDFGAEHPLAPIRLKMTYELARTSGALGEVIAPRPATRDELQLVHEPGYVDDVERISRTCGDPFASYGRGIGSGDNPAFRGMHEASALIAGGSI